MLIIFRIFVINQITMAKLNIEISGEFNTGKSTAIELIKEMFELYGVIVNIKGEVEMDSNKMKRVVSLINTIESVTLTENHDKYYIEKGIYS